MKKIGIATITILSNSNNAYNYGNKFQNYALQTYLKNKGFIVDTIKYNSSYPNYEIEKNAEKKSIEQYIDDIFRICKRKIFKKNILNKKNERIKKFNNFISNNISYTKKEYNYNSDFSELAKEYDYFITGSDQVWNPFYEGYNPFFYLGFAPEEKRISYAPSIAVNTIPENFKKEFGELVSGVKYKSIREDAGKELLKKEFNIDATLVCDPVFLLTKEEWKKIAIYPKINKKYFFVYILGKKTVETKRKIKYFEKKYNLKAIDVFNKDDKNTFFAGPEEFIGLLENSEFIFTDSFHGAALSTIFRKNFIILDRDSEGNLKEKKMNSRIESLMKLIEAKDRNETYIREHPERLNIDYSVSEEKINKFITNSKEFLDSALGIK